MITLKVKELIEQLQALDGELEVVSLNREHQYTSVIGKDNIFNTYIGKIVDTTVIKNKCVLLYE